MEYQHGGDIYRNSVDMDFSANINPLGLPAGVKEALYRGVEDCTCYPDSQCAGLREALSCHHRISPEKIICGNGAAELIFLIVRARKPEKALLTAPSFLEYEQALRAEGTEIAFLDLAEQEGFSFSAKRCKEFLNSQKDLPQLMFLCNPNNPTGLAVKKEEMKEILKLCKDAGIFCVVDECFHEFLDEPETYSILEEVQRGSCPHVFLLKAFTKIYAMAGLRLGYGLCSDEKLLESMNMLRQPWSVSSLAQAAGEAALKETEYVEQTRRVISCERKFLSEGLKKLGFKVWDSEANYLFFQDLRPEAKKSGRLLYDQCLMHRVLIRSCSNYRGLDGTYYRICVKQREENEKLLSILTSITEGK